jgi:DNA mismatch repair protein MutL
LLAYTPIPSVATTTLWGGAARSSEPREIGLDWTMAGEVSGQLAVNSDQLSPFGDFAVGSEQSPQSQANNIQHSTFNLPLLRLIGQIGSAYLVAEGPDGLYLIDQHAAHERVLFEKLMTQHELKSIPSQALLTPAVVHLPPAQAKLLESQLDALNHFGFEVELFGANAFQVRAMPTIFRGSDPSLALRSLVEDFEEDEAPLQAEVEAKLAGRVCKRLAVKAGQVLSPEEQRALLNDLEACDSPRTCPHGRPTMIHLSVDMLERQFGRKGPR